MTSTIQRPMSRVDARWLIAGAVLLGGLAWLLWMFAHDQSGIRRAAPKLSMIVPLPPPPPPPPKPKEEEPPKPVEEKTVQEAVPQAVEQTKPADAPPKADSEPQQAMTMDTPGQAGNDNFNIGAGSGGGMAGSGGGIGGGAGAAAASYSQYMSFALQRLLQDDERTRRLVFNLQLDIWLDPDGKLNKVVVTRSSGNEDTDRAVLSVLRAAPRLDERPSASQRFPAHVAISGRRPT